MRWTSKPRKGRNERGGWLDARDEATGLVPYPVFVQQCADAVALRTPGHEPAVLLVDLEGVSEAADVDGHEGVDEVMRVIASRATREVGGLGVVARMSDHQIGVLFPTLSAPAVALDLAYRMVSTVTSPVVLPSQRRVQLATSCGLVTWESMGARATVDDLLRGAGLAVREARRQGRNSIEVCTAALIAVADETLAIGKDLRKALDEKGLRVCYQPIVDLSHGTVIGFEALVRWSHPVHGQVSPARFVPVAEEFGMISELGRMVLSTATAQVAQWSATFRVPLTVHVNISGFDLVQDAFVSTVEEALQSSSLPGEQLVLEVTEPAVEQALEVATARFNALHGIGVRVALDDFGTGRSALAYLQSMPVDILKVDRSYVESEAEGRGDDMLRGVIAFGQALGMDVYGEGIEDEAQRTRLERNGCAVGQGYLFARPLPAEDAAAYLRTQAAPASLTQLHA
jgi:diguanylate cyclase (GGDEF)-like protein